MSPTRTCGKAIIELLEAYEVDVVFGIPGTHTLHLYAGLHGSHIRHVLSRTEQGAGFMADGYARATGRVGVCFVVGGPGLLNAATAMAAAYADSVPMLVISSATPSPTLDKGWGESHEIPYQRNATASFTAFSATAHGPADIPHLLGRAFAVFDSSRPRPVHIEIPKDLFEVPVAGDWRPYRRSRKPAPHPDAVAEVADLLRGARNPVIYAGGGAVAAADAVRRLAEGLAAPVATTVAAMGVIPSSHPLSLGSTITWEPARRVLEEADVLLALGTEMASQDFWEGPLNLQGKLVRVDIDPQKLADHFPAAVAVQADVGLFVEALLRTLAPNASATQRQVAETTVKETWQAVRRCVTDKEGRQERVVRTIQSAAADDALFFGDLTQLAYTAYRLMPTEKPGRFFTSKGFGALGYALPAAIGAKIACPRRPVVVMTGDSGLLYNVQEMATALEEQAPIAMVVWHNAGLGEIRDGFANRGIEPVAVSQRAPDHLALARAFGWKASRAATHQELRDTVKDALDGDSPALIEAVETESW